MNNQSSYCGLVDAKMKASDKDLPIQIFQEIDVRSLSHCKEVSRSWSNSIETEKSLRQMFAIMRTMYGQVWKGLPSYFMDWAVKNIHYIRIKWKQKGICYKG